MAFLVWEGRNWASIIWKPGGILINDLDICPDTADLHLPAETLGSRIQLQEGQLGGANVGTKIIVLKGHLRPSLVNLGGEIKAKLKVCQKQEQVPGLGNAVVEKSQGSNCR